VLVEFIDDCNSLYSTGPGIIWKVGWWMLGEKSTFVQNSLMLRLVSKRTGNRSVACSFGGLFGLNSKFKVDRVFHCLAGCTSFWGRDARFARDLQVRRLVCWLACWLVGMLVFWFVGWLWPDLKVGMVLANFAHESALHVELCRLVFVRKTRRGASQ